MTESERRQIIELIKKEVIPAIGCTEPIAVALCVAKAAETLGAKPEKIEVLLSANILKNAMGVGIPGTGMVGLPIAVALGALIGKSDYQLEVLRDCTSEAVEQGKTAGANAAGEALEYQPVAAALTFHGMNTALFAAGDNGKNPNLLYKTVEFQDMGKGQYHKYYFLNNRLCGVILIGDLSQMAKLTQDVEKHASYEEVMSR